MNVFDYKSLETLAIALPDGVENLRRAGDFEGELAAIDTLLSSGELTPSMTTRLTLERMIASGMQEDYLMDRATFLSRMQEHHPACDDALVDRMLASRHLDTILRGGQPYFQRSAVSNARNCCRKLIWEQEHPDIPYVPKQDTDLQANAAVMKEKGGRAFRYRARMSLTVDECARRPGERIRVWLPIPAECDAQSDIVIHDATPGMTLGGGKQPTAYFEEAYTPGREYFVEFSYTHRVPYVTLDPAAVSAEQPSFDTGEFLPHIRFSPTLRALARDIRGEEQNPLLVARRIYDWITMQVKYSYMRDYRLMESIAEFCAVNRRGDCGVQALLFITLCRICGIPAHWQSGNAVEPTGHVGSHDWARFYIAPYGWLYADPSYGGGAYRVGDALLRDHYFGNLDPFRMVCANDVQQPFDPAECFLRDDPYDNQSGEAEWADGSIPAKHLTKHKRILSAQEL